MIEYKFAAKATAFIYNPYGNRNKKKEKLLNRLAYSPLIAAGAIINLLLSLCIKLTAFLYAAVHTIWSITKLMFATFSAPVEYLFPGEQPGANHVRHAFKGVLQAASGALWTATHVCGAPFKTASQLWAYLYSGEQSITPLEDDVTLSITLSGLETVDKCIDECNDLIKNNQTFVNSTLQHDTAQGIAVGLRTFASPAAFVKDPHQKATAAELVKLMETVSVTAAEAILKDLLAPCGKQTQPIVLDAVHDWAKNRKSETLANILTSWISCVKGIKAALHEVKSLQDIDSHALLSNLPGGLSISGNDGSPMLGEPFKSDTFSNGAADIKGWLHANDAEARSNDRFMHALGLASRDY